MKKYLLIPLLFVSCSVVSQDKLYTNALKYTKRAEVVSSLETKALIDAVYLNPLFPDKFKKPTFLIGVYNDFDNTINNIEFNLTLNNKAPIEINSTIPNFIPYKQYPSYNEWMNYYIVKFNVKNRPYILKYKSKHWGETQIKF